MVNNSIQKHFPKHHRFSKVLNKNNTNVSFHCTRNIAAIISGHNKKVLKTYREVEEREQRLCNCRAGKEECLADGRCSVSCAVYQATITAEGAADKVYIGLTEGTLKNRITQHIGDFNHPEDKPNTKLARHYHQLVDIGLNPVVKFKCLKKHNPTIQRQVCACFVTRKRC